MKIRHSDPHKHAAMCLSPTGRHRRREFVHSLGLLRRETVPSMETVLRRMNSGPNFLETLTPEQWAAIDAYDGPEVLGPNAVRWAE